MSSEIILHHKIYGQGPPIIIAHGLFGMLDNWHSFAKTLSQDYQVITVDLRNHGRSFHHDKMTYLDMSEDIINLLDHLNLSKAHLVGHSMGGKVVAQLALSHSDRVETATVIDILPLEYERGHEEVLNALNDVDIRSLDSRREVEAEMLRHLNGEKSTALFLMKSLQRSLKGGFNWRFNLEVLTRDYDLIREGVTGDPFTGPTLFVMGGNSKYITMDGWIATSELFPRADLVEIENAGHWVHVDQGDILLEKVKSFLTKSSSL